MIVYFLRAEPGKTRLSSASVAFETVSNRVVPRDAEAPF